MKSSRFSEEQSRCQHGGQSAIARYGAPEDLGSDNGPEFIASCMQGWLNAQEIKTLYIKPESRWENGHIESFTTSCAVNA